MRKLLLWLVMVAMMVAAILGGTAAFLYSRTGEDALPQEPVQFGDITLESNGWDWIVPVLGDKVTKTYERPGAAINPAATPIPMPRTVIIRSS